MKKLTHKQEHFAQLVSYESTYADAYRSAYDVRKNTSSNTIYVKSSRLMDESKISLWVSELQKKTAERNQATLDEVLGLMSGWLKFNMKSIFNSDGTMKELTEMADEEASCISDFTVEEIWGGRGRG